MWKCHLTACLIMLQTPPPTSHFLLAIWIIITAPVLVFIWENITSCTHWACRIILYWCLKTYWSIVLKSVAGYCYNETKRTENVIEWDRYFRRSGSKDPKVGVNYWVSIEINGWTRGYSTVCMVVSVGKGVTPSKGPRSDYAVFESI